MGDQYTVRQANQPVIPITKAPIQQLATLVRQIASTNRTRRADDERMETKDPEDIDRYVTHGEHKDKTNDNDEKLTLKFLRTGSTWTRTAAYWSGKVDDDICQLCVVAEETADHLWKSCKLKEKAKEIDKYLAEMTSWQTLC